MLLSCKLGVSVLARRNRICSVLVCVLASSLAGCGGRSESGQDGDVSVGEQLEAPVEVASRGSGVLDETGAAGGSDEGAPSVPEASGGIDIASNEQSGAELDVPTFYTVAAYDVDRDPAADLIMTISKAKQGEKRILLQVGGDWCNWCGRLADFMRERESVRTLLNQHFLIMKVASQSKFADAFLADYPKINAYPFVYVLSPAGELLHSQDMEELELGEGYDEEAFVDFLEAWSVSHADVPSGLIGSDGL